MRVINWCEMVSCAGNERAWRAARVICCRHSHITCLPSVRATERLEPLLISWFISIHQLIYFIAYALPNVLISWFIFICQLVYLFGHWLIFLRRHTSYIKLSLLSCHLRFAFSFLIFTYTFQHNYDSKFSRIILLGISKLLQYGIKPTKLSPQF